MSSTTASEASSSSYSPASSRSTSLSTPPSPSSRRRPESLRLSQLGIDPCEIIGKTLKRARRSSTHPSMTLDFSDHTAVQVLVDGYDPAHPGIPKHLETDGDFDAMLMRNDPLGLQVIDCAFITLQDTALDRKHAKSPSATVYWDQKHLGVALKFSEEQPRWHCIWARMEEFDEQQGACVFRSYDDVYLERLSRPSQKSTRSKTKSQRKRNTQSYNI